MRKIPVRPAGNGKHPDKVKGDGDGDGGPTPSDPNDSQTHQMDGKEGDAANPVYLGRALYFCMLKAGPGIKPAKK